MHCPSPSPSPSLSLSPSPLPSPSALLSSSDSSRSANPANRCSQYWLGASAACEGSQAPCPWSGYRRAGRTLQTAKSQPYLQTFLGRRWQSIYNYKATHTVATPRLGVLRNAELVIDSLVGFIQLCVQRSVLNIFLLRGNLKQTAKGIRAAITQSSPGGS